MAVATTGRPGDGQRLIHDAANGAGTASALGAAAEAMIDLPGRAWDVVARRKGRAHILIGEHVARTHDHRGKRPGKD